MANELLFPVYVYEEGMALPKEGTYFVVAGNGPWLHKDTGLVRCFVPVKNVSCLPDLPAEVEVACKLPKIPARLVWRVKQFFRRVVEAYRAESEVTLYYNAATADFKVHIPEQEVSHGGVSYARAGLSHLADMADYLRVGTIHSHSDFGAFHSGTDEGDEEDFDGLHVTFGHNDRDEFTIAASVVVNGHRSKIDPLAVLDGINPSGPDTYRLADSDHDPEHHAWAEGLDGWMAKVRPTTWGLRNYNYSDLARPTFPAGSRVAWAGGPTPTTAAVRATLGDGPFEVARVDGEHVVVQTQAGLARLSEKLFRRADA